MTTLGPAACRANVNYYTNIEDRLYLELLEAQKDKEYWELQLLLQHEKNDNT
jgi:hypothetical protein